MNFRTRIETKLREAFDPVRLEVVDESDNHLGHSGWREGGETHFRVRLASPAFAGKSRVEIHRAIHDVLRTELQERVHALAIEAESA